MVFKRDRVWKMRSGGGGADVSAKMSYYKRWVFPEPSLQLPETNVPECAGLKRELESGIPRLSGSILPG